MTYTPDIAGLTEAAADADALADLLALHPVAGFVPWTRRDREPIPEGEEDPDPQWGRYTSQRDALETCFALPDDPLDRILCVGVWGGNGSGKTWIARFACVLVLLGRDHPSVRAFLAATGCELPWLSDGPGRVLFVAKSSNDSIRYHRKDVRGLLPSAGAHRWYNLNAKGEAHVIVEGDAESADGAIVQVGKGEAWFKSADQGWEAFQGDKWDAVQIDEELLQPDGERTFDELLQRVARVAGRMLYSMTSLSGPQTWTIRRLDSPRTPSWMRIARLDALDNPHIDTASILLTYDGMSEGQRLQRQRGEAVALEGRLYPALDLVNVGPWDGGCHLVHASFHPPADWPRYIGGDYGHTAPSAIVWTATDPDGRRYDYRVLYCTGLDSRRLAQIVAWLSGSPDVPEPAIPTMCGGGTGYRSVYGAERAEPPVGDDGELTGEWGEHIEVAWMDPAAPQVIRALQAVGVNACRAQKEWAKTTDSLRQSSAVAADGRPRWYMRQDLAPLIAELAALVHGTGAGGEPKETAARGADHLADAKRYQDYGIRRYTEI